MRIVSCKCCGKQFRTNKPHALYCSDTCRVAGIREKRIVWEAQNPGYNMLYYKKQRQKQKSLETMTAQANQD